MKKTKISVLIASLNGNSKLARLLEQIANQEGVEFELLLLDDGSQPPLSEPPCGKLIQHDKNTGLIISRNELARLASSPLLLFLDDDIILPINDYLKKVVEYAEKFGECGVIAIPQKEVDGQWSKLQPGAVDAPNYVSRYYGWAHIVRKEVWDNSGGLCEIFDYGYEETEHCWRMLEQGVRIICIPELAVIHDSASPSKNLLLRHNQNLRNQLIANLLHARWTTLPRIIFSHIQLVWNSNREMGQSLSKSLGWLIWELREVFARSKYIFQNRQPLSRSTFELIRNLESSTYQKYP